VYTARNFTLSREGQVTDRYTKAIEQLGSDKPDVRTGGIYAPA
jgi:aspartyl-tRNA synthetase